METIYSRSFALTYDNGDTSLERIPIMPVKTGQVHNIMEGETLQSIAYQYYGDSAKWADLADANDIVDPIAGDEVLPGKQLIIPNL